jgi:hypothetical protein
LEGNLGGGAKISRCRSPFKSKISIACRHWPVEGKPLDESVKVNTFVPSFLVDFGLLKSHPETSITIIKRAAKPDIIIFFLISF